MSALGLALVFLGGAIVGASVVAFAFQSSGGIALTPGRVLILENAETGGNMTVTYKQFNGVQKWPPGAPDTWCLSVYVSHERGPFLLGRNRWEDADTEPSRQNRR